MSPAKIPDVNAGIDRDNLYQLINTQKAGKLFLTAFAESKTSDVTPAEAGVYGLKTGFLLSQE